MGARLLQHPQRVEGGLRSLLCSAGLSRPQKCAGRGWSPCCSGPFPLGRCSCVWICQVPLMCRPPVSGRLGPGAGQGLQATGLDGEAGAVQPGPQRAEGHVLGPCCRPLPQVRSHRKGVLLCTTPNGQQGGEFHVFPRKVVHPEQGGPCHPGKARAPEDLGVELGSWCPVSQKEAQRAGHQPAVCG